jgi:hypothetical protein
MSGETKQDDSIIELTDVVEDGQGAEETLSDDILSDVEISDDSAIELTDIEEFNDIEMDAEPDVQEIEPEDPSRDELDGNDSFSEEAIAVDKTSDSGEMSASDQLSISDEQIEAALERVIEKRFAEKIEPLLFDTMERVILQEIQKIKAALFKDMDQIGPF